MKMAKTVEEYLDTQIAYRPLLDELRSILNGTELIETIKWGIPTYQINKKNVVGIGAFKSYAGLWFFNGALLKDEAGVLINAQEGKTKGMRQWRFASMDEVDEALILKYVKEAIQNEKDGKVIKPEKKPLVIPAELKEALASDSEFAESFTKLKLTYQREYCEYIAEAKRTETKQKRLDRVLPMIKEGIGLNDKYR